MPSSDSLLDAAVDRIAAQWIALGCQLAGEEEAGVVDLEALIAATVQFVPAGDRVYDASLAWCAVQGQVINVTRLGNVASYIGVQGNVLEEYAAAVRGSGGPRWPFAVAHSTRHAHGKVLVTSLTQPPRLLWRVRAAFGVNARADVLVYLLQLPGSTVSLADLARRTHFTKVSVAQAVAGMRLAGVVVAERVGNEDRVRINPELPLRRWLLPELPHAYLDWADRWRVVSAVLRAWDSVPESGPVVRSVELRAAVEPLLALLDNASLPAPDLTAVGPAFAQSFDAWAVRLEDVLRHGE